jgi:hypothetical protein
VPARLPIKENPGEPGLQSTASDGHRHTPHRHNLNYTIWTQCWISKFPPMPHLSGRTLINRGAPFPIYQAKLSALFSQGRPLSNLSGKLGCILLPGVRPFQSIRQTWARPSPRGMLFPINQTVCQELGVDGGLDGDSTLQWRLFLACLARNSGAERDV